MKNLIVQAILGLAFLMISMATALFLSAGSLGFWQAWGFLAVFFGSTTLVTIYLIKYDQNLLASRTKAGPTAETQKSQKIIQSLASVFFIATLVVPGLDFRFHWSTVPPIISWISDGFIALGFLIVFLVFKENSYTSAVIELAHGQPFRSHGY